MTIVSTSHTRLMTTQHWVLHPLEQVDGVGFQLHYKDRNSLADYLTGLAKMSIRLKQCVF